MQYLKSIYNYKNSLPKYSNGISLQGSNTFNSSMNDKSWMKSLANKNIVKSGVGLGSMDTITGVSNIVMPFIENATTTSQIDMYGNKFEKKDVGVGALSGAASGAGLGTMIAPGIGCVCAGTKIYTGNGQVKNIEDLTKEDGILGWDNKKAVSEKIIEFQDIAIKPCVELITKKGYSLKCSIDHPIVWSTTDFYKELPKSETDGKRIRVKAWNWKEAGDIKVGEQIAIINEIPFFGSKEMWEPRLIGMLIGDGSYSLRKGVRYWSIDEELQNYIEEKGGEHKETRISKNGKLFKGYSLKDITNNLENLGIKGQVGGNKTLPTALWLFNKKSLEELIGGLYDTDGCVNLDGDRINIKIGQISKDIIYSLRDILIRFGIHGNISIEKAKTSELNNKFINSKEMFVFTIRDKNSLIAFYENFKFLIKYKQDKLNLIPILYGNKNSKYNTDNGVIFDSIIEIKDLGDKEIYNLEVDNSHTYIANNIVTHNTAIGAGLGAIWGGATTGMENDENLKALAESNKKYSNSMFDNAKQTQKNLVAQGFNSQGTTGMMYKKGGNVIKPQYEVEQGEVIQGNNVELEAGHQLASDIHKVDGKKHEQGGVNGSGGNIVNSDSIVIGDDFANFLKQFKYKFKPTDTVAQVAEKLGKDKGKYEKNLNSKDALTVKTANVMIKRIDELSNANFENQENIKGIQEKEENMQAYKKGGNLPMYKKGIDIPVEQLLNAGVTAANYLNVDNQGTNIKRQTATPNYIKAPNNLGFEKQNINSEIANTKADIIRKSGNINETSARLANLTAAGLDATNKAVVNQNNLDLQTNNMNVGISNDFKNRLAENANMDAIDMLQGKNAILTNKQNAINTGLEGFIHNRTTQEAYDIEKQKLAIAKMDGGRGTANRSTAAIRKMVESGSLSPSDFERITGEKYTVKKGVI